MNKSGVTGKGDHVAEISFLAKAMRVKLNHLTLEFGFPPRVELRDFRLAGDAEE